MARGKGKAYLWLCANANHTGDDCLIFPFHRNSQRGYGTFGLNGELRYAHRFMCELVNGPAPSSRHQASHSCGRGHDGCVNPRHLSWATNSVNQIERWRGNGSKITNRSGNRTKLKPELIAEMRALKGREAIQSIADRMGVKRGCVEYWQRHDRPPATRNRRRAS